MNPLCPRVTWSVAAASALGILALGALLLSAGPAGADTGRQHCRYGIYVRELKDINLPHDNFTATFDLWSLCDQNRRIGRADFLWTVNGTMLRKSLVRMDTTPGGYWRAVKVTGTFHKTWSMARYPFDHQTLQLMIGTGYTSTDDTVASVDTEHSAIAPGLAAEGLHLRDFTVQPGYLSTDFAEGNPAYVPGSEIRWNTMTVTIDMVRRGWLSLIPLQAPLWAGVIAAAVNYFFTRRVLSVILGRLSLAGAAVLTIVFNTQQTHDQLNTTELTTVDILQVIGLVYACASAGVTALTWVRITQGASEGWVRRFNRWSLILTTTAYLALSALAIAIALDDHIDENVMPITACPDQPGACMFWRQPST